MAYTPFSPRKNPLFEIRSSKDWAVFLNPVNLFQGWVTVNKKAEHLKVFGFFG